MVRTEIESLKMAIEEYEDNEPEIKARVNLNFRMIKQNNGKYLLLIQQEDKPPLIKWEIDDEFLNNEEAIRELQQEILQVIAFHLFTLHPSNYAIKIEPKN